MENTPKFRKPTSEEWGILNHLLSGAFAGRDLLVQQLDGIQVAEIDVDHSLALRTIGHPAVPGLPRIIREGYVEQADGRWINILLHATNGLLSELEIYSDAPSMSVSLPEASSITILGD